MIFDVDGIICAQVFHIENRWMLHTLLFCGLLVTLLESIYSLAK